MNVTGSSPTHGYGGDGIGTENGANGSENMAPILYAQCAKNFRVWLVVFGFFSLCQRVLLHGHERTTYKLWSASSTSSANKNSMHTAAALYDL